MDTSHYGFAIKVSCLTDKFAWQAVSQQQQLASLPGVFWLSEESAVQAARDEIDRRQLLHSLETAQSWLEHAYCISRSMYVEQEPWAVALADSLHHCQESLEKLSRENASEQP